MAEDMKPDEERRKKLVPVLAKVLHELCKRNDHIVVDPAHVTKFHALRAPAISIEDYLQRISKYSGCSEECFILSLIYIDRLINDNKNLIVNSFCVHRLIITRYNNIYYLLFFIFFIALFCWCVCVCVCSIMLAAKFFDDQYFNNAYYGKVGGVTCKEVNSLEIEFLFMINFNLYVSESEVCLLHFFNFF